MGFLKELFEVREVTAPSGVTYGIKNLNGLDFAVALKLIPTLLPSNGSGSVSGEEEKAAQAVAVASVGIVYAKLGDKREDGPIVPELVPALDAVFLSNAVLEAALHGPESDKLRRALRGSNRGEKPGRARAKVRGNSVGAHAGGASSAVL